MNAPLRRVGVVVLVLFGLLFANLNWVQAYKSGDYQRSDYNGRVQVDEYQRQRGVIQAGRDSKALATSKATNGELKYLRTYPYDELYAHVVGYKPVNGAATGIERSEDDYLSGSSDRLFGDRLRDMLTGEQTPGGNVLLTLSRRAQQTAYEELRDNRKNAKVGAVVAVDPRTGAVQALVSYPSFDPNPLVSHDTKAASAAYKRLEAAENKPLNNRAIGERFPPGSTFKVIDSAAALEKNIAPDASLPAGAIYQPPVGRPIKNASGVSCASRETLKDALTKSCNTTFSRLCVEQLNADVIAEKARAFGFEDTDLQVGRLGGGGLSVAESRLGDRLKPNGQQDAAALAQTCIGQYDVQMTPMQGALVASAVANGGSQMRPYLVQQLRGADLTTVHYTATTQELRRPISSQTAANLQEMMVSVVQGGTGRNARITGYTVGGKTGTAENAEDEKDHGWFIGFTIKDGVPISAVCVLLVNGGDGSSAEAARIGGKVMQAVIRDRGGD